jgi:hypothetical protein
VRLNCVTGGGKLEKRECQAASINKLMGDFMSETILSKLGRICDCETPKISKPMTFTDKQGDAWTFGSDGHLLVAVKGDFDCPEPSFGAERAMEQPEKTYTISFQALKRFVDSPPVWDDSEYCDECEEWMPVLAPPRIGQIDDYYFQRELLARIIDTVPTQPEFIEAGINKKQPEGEYLFLLGDTWKASLMAMRNINYAEGWEMPKFELEVKL